MEGEPAPKQRLLVLAEGGLAHRADEADVRQRVGLVVAQLAAKAQAHRHVP